MSSDGWNVLVSLLNSMLVFIMLYDLHTARLTRRAKKCHWIAVLVNCIGFTVWAFVNNWEH